MAGIFKAYDIRGVYGRDLTPQVVRRLGYSFAGFYGRDFLIGIDTRTHSLDLYRYLADGALRAVSVHFLGNVTTPMAHYAAKALDMPTLMVTASHNPPEYNGVKPMHPGGMDLEKHELEEVERMFNATADVPERYVGFAYAVDVLGRYADYLSSKFGDLRGMRIGFDPANGAGTVLYRPLREALGMDVWGINVEPDGRFPSHPPDPEKPENLAQLREHVVANGLRAGLALDGDGDRIGIVTATGRVFRPEHMVLVLLEEYAGPGDIIVLDITQPLYLERVAAERGVKVVRQRVGHSFQKPTAVRHNAVFWAEYSGHIGFRDNSYFDDGIFAGLRILQLTEARGTGLDEYLARAPQVFQERIDVRVDDQAAVMGRVAREAERLGEEVLTIDGVDMRFRRGRVLIRPSNTEPLIRIKVESETKEGFEELRSLALRLVKGG